MAGCAHGPIFSPAYKELLANYVCRPCLEVNGISRRMNGWRYMLHLWRRHKNVEFQSCSMCRAEVR